MSPVVRAPHYVKEEELGHRSVTCGMWVEFSSLVSTIGYSTGT